MTPGDQTSSGPTGTTAGGSLRGLRVLDLSRVLAGPLCTQLLGDHGADVVKVEPPAGDETRTWGPPFLSDSVSAYFNNLNRNKSNVCLDLRREAGQRLLGDLLARSDVVVENFKPGTLERWGLGDDVLRARYPGLVQCRITGFGADGPMGGMPGYDAACQAYGGLLSINGEPDGQPLRIGVPIVDMVTGIYAFSGILLALHERNRTGLGQLVDCTLIDAAVSLLHPHSAAHLADGRVPRRTGSAHPTIAPYDTFDARDGQIFIGAGNDRQFAQLAEALGRAELVDDPRFATNAGRVASVQDLRQVLAAAVAEHDRHALARDLLSKGVPATAVHDVAEALADPHVRHREMVVEMGDYRGVGIPIKLSSTPGSVRETPQAQGADTRRVLTDLGLRAQDIDALVADAVAFEARPPTTAG